MCLITCPDDIGLERAYYSVDFSKSKTLLPDLQLAEGVLVPLGDQDNGLTFAKRYDAPTMSTNFNYSFGRVEVVAKSAPGTGIVSSMVLLSADLDEIDWKFFGG